MIVFEVNSTGLHSLLYASAWQEVVRLRRAGVDVRLTTPADTYYVLISDRKAANEFRQFLQSHIVSYRQSEGVPPGFTVRGRKRQLEDGTFVWELQDQHGLLAEFFRKR